MTVYITSAVGKALTIPNNSLIFSIRSVFNVKFVLLAEENEICFAKSIISDVYDRRSLPNSGLYSGAVFMHPCGSMPSILDMGVKTSLQA